MKMYSEPTQVFDEPLDFDSAGLDDGARATLMANPGGS